MFNFDYIIKDYMITLKEHNPNWQEIPDNS